MSAAAPRSRRRKLAAAACTLLAFASAAGSLLSERGGNGAAAAAGSWGGLSSRDGSSFSGRVALWRTTEEQQRVLPSPGSDAPGGSSSLPFSARPSSSYALLLGANGTAAAAIRGDGERGVGGGGEVDPRRRAVIRTFYHPLSSHSPSDLSSHAGQVDLWRTAWSEAGWTPVVLTLDDALRHPRYSEFASRIDALDWCAPEGSTEREFQILCFVRWIAYAADGPGYVSDYDILPLSFELAGGGGGDGGGGKGGGGGVGTPPPLPNGGTFTAYDPIVSSFASAGSGAEWDRVLTAMLDAAEEHRRPRRPDEPEGPEGRRSRGTACRPGLPPDETGWQITDMQAMQVLKYALWKGLIPRGSMHVPDADRNRRPPCAEIVNEVEFEEWTVERPEHCPGAAHFSGKAGMERDGRLGTARSMWEEWRDLCRTRRGCAKAARARPGGIFQGPHEGRKTKGRNGRGVVLNLAAGASIVATVVAALM